MGISTAQARQLGRLIARARAKKGLSLRDLQQQVGIPRSWLGYLEQAGPVSVDPERLTRLAEALDIPPQRIDRITKGAITGNMPEPRVYFRAKFDLTADEAAEVERYIAGIQGRV